MLPDFCLLGPLLQDGRDKGASLAYVTLPGPALLRMTKESHVLAFCVGLLEQHRKLSAGESILSSMRKLHSPIPFRDSTVHINTPTVHDKAALLHGGFKHSRFGRFGGSWGLNEFLTIKTITSSYKE